LREEGVSAAEAEPAPRNFLDVVEVGGAKPHDRPDLTALEKDLEAKQSTRAALHLLLSRSVGALVGARGEVV
jgi:hypothetical protein